MRRELLKGEVGAAVRGERLKEGERMSHLLRKTKTEDELEIWLDKNMTGKKTIKRIFFLQN